MRGAHCRGPPGAEMRAPMWVRGTGMREIWPRFRPMSSPRPTGALRGGVRRHQIAPPMPRRSRASVVVDDARWRHQFVRIGDHDFAQHVADS